MLEYYISNRLKGVDSSGFDLLKDQFTQLDIFVLGEPTLEIALVCICINC